MTDSTPRPARVTKRRAETRARLMAAGYAVFAERGLGRTTIEDVCEAAGFTRGAFYSNFASLDELFFAMFEDRAAAAAARIAEQLSSAAPAATVPQLVDRVVGALDIERSWLVLRTDVALSAARNPALAEAFTRHEDAVRDALARVLAAGIDRSRLPPGLRRPKALARAVLDVYMGASRHLLVSDDAAATRRWIRELLTALLSHATE